MERRIAPGLRMTGTRRRWSDGFRAVVTPGSQRTRVRFGQRPVLPRMPQERALVRSGRSARVWQDADPCPLASIQRPFGTPELRPTAAHRNAPPCPTPPAPYGRFRGWALPPSAGQGELAPTGVSAGSGGVAGLPSRYSGRCSPSVAFGAEADVA
jgi:hypothetical protein